MHDTHLSHIAAFGLILGVYYSFYSALKGTLYGVSSNTINPAFDYRSTVFAAIALTIFDMVMFMVGLSHRSFFGTGINFITVVASVGYSVALLYAAKIHVTLSERDTL